MSKTKLQRRIEAYQRWLDIEIKHRYPKGDVPDWRQRTRHHINHLEQKLGYRLTDWAAHDAEVAQ